MAKKRVKKPKKVKKVKRVTLCHLESSPDDEWAEEAAHPITAMQRNVDIERSHSRRALQRAVDDLEELELQEAALRQMTAQLKRGGRWLSASGIRLVPGRWYIVRQTRYAGKPRHYYPSGLIVMAKWLEKNGGWSAHTRKLSNGGGLCVFAPNSKDKADDDGEEADQ